MDTLSDWLTPLPDAVTMRAIDRWAIDDRGVPGIDLMERAGAAVARAAETLVPDGPVTVFCGKGNNGGDGLVVARLLRHAGREVTVLSTIDPTQYSGDALANLERLPGPPPLTLDAGAVPPPAKLVIDALLGTGFHGEPDEAMSAAIEAVGASGAPVVSVDVPSGVDASTGIVAGVAVRATATVTFHAAKPGLWISPGKRHAGRVETVDIGIPHWAPAKPSAGLISPRVLALLPRRGADGTKFSSGHVLVVGGSPGLTGAPTMSARAAMRAGAGYVTVCVPTSLQPVLAVTAAPEVMSLALPELDGQLSRGGVERVTEAASRGGALALGPGIGRGHEAQRFALSLAAAVEVPLVLDADGLNAHAGRLGDLLSRKAPTVLTPHAGELARLLESDSESIERERLASVRRAAENSGAIVVLKGDDTLVCRPDGRVAVNPGGSPALASAGTGDVLTGVLAALLAQGLDAFTAACAAVFMHARAGRIAARRIGAAEGVLAGDVIESLPSSRQADWMEGEGGRG